MHAKRTSRKTQIQLAIAGLMALNLPKPACGDLIFSNRSGGIPASSFDAELRGSAVRVAAPVNPTNLWQIELIGFQVSSAIISENLSAHIRVYDKWSPASQATHVFRDALLDITVPLAPAAYQSGYRVAYVDLKAIGEEFVIQDDLIGVDVVLWVNGVPGTLLGTVLLRPQQALIVGGHTGGCYTDFQAPQGVLTANEIFDYNLDGFDRWALGMVIEGSEVPDPLGLGLQPGFPSDPIPEPSGALLLLVSTGFLTSRCRTSCFTGFATQS